ncbi:MAG: glutaredoxin [Nannocystaceae bacterium]
MTPTTLTLPQAETKTKTKIKTAALYRLVTDDHVCPYGLKSLDLLERAGYRVADHPLESEAEARAFRERWGVETTPQTFLDGVRIGGWDDLRAHFGEAVADADATSYRPVITLFAVTFLMALGAAWTVEGQLLSLRTVEWFVAFTMCGLGYLKLRDVEGFSLMFLGYDRLAQRYVPYSYVYPYAETGAGLLMIAGVLPWVSAPVALFLGSVGASSVIKAVYVDKRELQCACVGGGSDVPLGFVSLTENLAMIGMGAWTGIKALLPLLRA